LDVDSDSNSYIEETKIDDQNQIIQQTEISILNNIRGANKIQMSNKTEANLIQETDHPNENV